MAKQLTFSEEARSAMKRGIDTMADTVGVTLGPRGRNVVLDKKFGPPQVFRQPDNAAFNRHRCYFSSCVCSFFIAAFKPSSTNSGTTSAASTMFPAIADSTSPEARFNT